jgi:hypothetical protein
MSRMPGQKVEASVKKDREWNGDIQNVPRYAVQSTGREGAKLYANELLICLVVSGVVGKGESRTIRCDQGGKQHGR